MAVVSSCREVLGFYNERNPYRQLPADNAGDSNETVGVNREEGGDDVKSARPLRLGLYMCYNGQYKGQLLGDWMLIFKVGFSSD